MLHKLVTRTVFSALLMGAMVTAPAFADELPAKSAAAVASGHVNWDVFNLTPAQIKQINKIRMDYSKKAIKLKAEIALKNLSIQEQLMSPAPVSPARATKLLQERLALESELQTASLNNFLAIKQLLSPQQLAKMPQAITVK
jgi:Spy/CpxP family protein refolding chaperone